MRAETRWGTLMILAAGTLALAGCDGPPPAIAERAGAGGHTAEVVALAYTPDGTMLVSRGADAVRVWDAATLVERQKLPSDGAEFGGLAINPDGRTMATTRAGRGIDLWIVPDRSWTVSNIAVDPAAAVAPPGTFGWGLAFAPDGTTLAGPAPEAGANPAIQFWKVTRGEEAGATTTELVPTGVGLPGSPATHLAYTPDGKTLIAKSMEGQIRVWDVARQAERATIDANLSYLAAIGVSPDGATVASSGADRYPPILVGRDGEGGRQASGPPQGDPRRRLPSRRPLRRHGRLGRDDLPLGHPVPPRHRPVQGASGQGLGPGLPPRRQGAGLGRPGPADSPLGRRSGARDLRAVVGRLKPHRRHPRPCRRRRASASRSGGLRPGSTSSTSARSSA